MSRFVSGGTTEAPLERDEEWRKAQEEIEANHRRKIEEGQQEGGKSLYEVLQANKAAKQEAFEEATRLKNQFRTLDEDEVEFLDSVLESTRAKESAIRKETTEQLEQFRKLQNEANKAAVDEIDAAGAAATAAAGVDAPAEQETWAVGRKRKKAPEKPGFRAKLRKSSTAATPAATPEGDAKEGKPEAAEQDRGRTPAGPAEQKKDIGGTPTPRSSTEPGTASATQVRTPAPSPPKIPLLGLANYSSDEDD